MRIPSTMRQPALWTRLLSLLVLLFPVVGWAQVSPTPFSLTSSVLTHNQNFDTPGTPSSGSTVGNGFGFYETGSGANGAYVAGIGTETGGNTYSYGATAAATDRALGGLQSGSLIPTIGAAYVNNTGSIISQLAITYTGEQWRLGTSGRAIPDRLDFQYSTNATSLSTGTYVDFDRLDFTGPLTTGTVGALNGNATASRTTRSATIRGLSIAPGATFYIRWNSFDASGADDGLAVDDFSLTATVINPTLAVVRGATSYANGGTAYSFGSQTQSVTSSPVAFTLSNTSSDTLTISSITATGDFAVSGTVPTVVLPGSTATVNATFTPTATGARTGTLVINSNALNTVTATPPALGAYTVNLSGTGTASTVNPEINVQQAGTTYLSGDTFSGFANTPQTQTSAPVTFTIQNTSSTDALSISSITTTGNFAVSGTAPTSVAANGSATVSVTFSPTATGTRTGTLVINSNDQDEPAYTITLQGEGQTAPPTLTAINPTTAIGGATYSVTLTGTNFGTTANTTVNFNGSSIAPSFVNAGGTSLTVALPVPATAGSYPVTVTTATGTTSAQNLAVTAPVAGFYEPFEPGTQSGYATAGSPATVALRTGAYTFVEALLANSGSDQFNNSQGARIRGGGFIAMNFDKTGGAGTVTLSAALFADDAAGTFTLAYSTDGGQNYTPVTTGVPTALTATLTPYTFTLNVPGPVRLRIGTSNTTASSNPRINIDDLKITDYAGPACVAPTSVAVGSITGTTASVSFTGDASATGYTVTATPSTGSPVTATGTASPIGLTGLTAGTSYNVTVTSTCTGGGTATSSPAVNFSTPAAPVNPQIAISQGGTGYASGNAYGFPTAVPVGSSSGQVQFTITNAGPDPLTLSGFVPSGAEFVTSGTNPTTVAANGGTATFNVVFVPSATGSRSGSITINNNSSATPAFVLNFNGTGTAASNTFTAGNLVVTRLGDGSSALSAAAAPVFLDEFNTTMANQSTTVRTVALPTTDQNGNQTLTLAGNSTTVGNLSRSIDGQYLTIGGYDAAVGTAAVGGTTAAAVNRTVARIGINANVSVTTALNDAYSAGDFRGVTTTSGTNLWLSGSNAGIRYTTTGSTTSTSLATSNNNTRVIGVFDSKVYYSTASGSTTRGIWEINGDFPTTAGAGTTQVVATGASSDPYGFVFLETDSSTPGSDLLYIIDGTTLLKYSKGSNGSGGFVWTARGSRTGLATNARSLTGRLTTSGTVELFYNTSAAIYAATDATAPTASISGAIGATTLATAGTNTAFRGVAFAPELLDLVADGVISTHTDRDQFVDGGTYRNIYASSGFNIRSVGPLSASGAVTVRDNSTFDPGYQPVTGSASFTMQPNSANEAGGLVIRHPQGLSLTGATGQIQVTGTRTYGSGYGYFIFDNEVGAAQVTGPGFPDVVTSITNFATSDVTLSRPLSVRSRVQLGTNGFVLNGQALTLLSTNTPQPGAGDGQAQISLSPNSTANVVGTTTTVQRAITNPTAIGYRHYSSPVAAETLGTLATAGFTPVFNPAYNTSATPNLVTPFPTVFGYDETRLRPAANGGSPATNFTNPFDKGWFSPTAATPWTVADGYTVNIARTAVVDFTGQVNNGNITRTGLTRTNADGGWHLLGNPYPEHMTWASATRSADPNDPSANLAGMDAAIYVYEASSQYGGSYRSYVNNVGDPNVALGQGFFVRTSAVGAAGTVRFSNSLRSAGASAQFRDARPLLRLAVADAAATLTDNATVYFDATATAAFDGAADAYKLTNPSGLTLGTVLSNGESLSIDGRPSLAGQTQIIPLMLSVPQAGTYTFSVAGFANLGGATVVLRDALTGTRTVLAAGSSYRTTLAGTSAPGRFALEFQPAAAPLATSAQALAAQVQLYPNPTTGRFHLALPLGTTAKPVAATLTNALGQTVLSRTLTTTEADFDVRGLAAGVYNLRLSLDGAQVVRRVVVQ